MASSIFESRKCEADAKQLSCIRGARSLCMLLLLPVLECYAKVPLMTALCILTDSGMALQMPLHP